MIHQCATFRSVGLREVVMAASHGITHEIMHHLAVGTNAGGRYSDKISSPNLSNPGLWLFLGIYDEPRELYFLTCTASQRCTPTAMGLNGKGRFNGKGTVVAPISVVASAGSRCSCR